MRKISGIVLVFLLISTIQYFVHPLDTAELYPGMSTDEVEARTDSLVREYYNYASEQVDSLFERFIRERHPGAAVAVIQDGYFLHKNSYGVANLNTRTPITSDTQFLLASVSKQFTAVAILILVEEGKMSLDDPITQYFDNLPKAWRPITVRHLLTHTSGIPDRFRLIGYAEGWTNRQILNRLIQHRRLKFRPGSRFRYSNSGYNLLAMIVEEVSGQSFREFAHRKIFLPAGMYDTLIYDETKPEFSNRAVAYRPTRRGYYRSNDFLLFTTGASGIFSTIEDLFRWDQALYSEQIISNDLLEESFKPHAKASRRESYGYGWRLTEGKDGKSVYHTGTLGGSSNIFFRIPGKKFSVIILSNRALKSRKWLVRKITDIYHPGLTQDVGF